MIETKKDVDNIHIKDENKSKIDEIEKLDSTLESFLVNKELKYIVIIEINIKIPAVKIKNS